MTIFVAVLIFIVCIALMGIILIQNSKGGGLSSSFGASNQVLGVRKTTDFLEKATWTLAITLLVLSLVSAAISGGVNKVEVEESEIMDFVSSEQVQNAQPLETTTNPLEGGPAEQPE